MPQFHCYLDQATGHRLREEAKAQGLSVSKYIAQILSREVEGSYPAGFWDEVYGCWAGEPLERPPQLDYDQRDPMQVHEDTEDYQ